MNQLKLNHSFLAGNFFQVVLENSELLKNILPHLWTKLLMFSLNDDSQLLQVVYNCYNQQFLIENIDDTNENDDSSESTTLTGLEFLEYQIKLCQSKIGNYININSIEFNSNIIQSSIPITILECMVNTSFLKTSLDLLITNTTEQNLIESQNNLIISISKILYCTPPGRLFEDVIPSKSISQTILRIFAFDGSSQKL